MFVISTPTTNWIILKRFSYFYDFPDTTQLQSVKSNAHDEIFERITQDVFNQSQLNGKPRTTIEELNN